MPVCLNKFLTGGSPAFGRDDLHELDEGIVHRHYGKLLVALRAGNDHRLEGRAHTNDLLAEGAGIVKGYVHAHGRHGRGQGTVHETAATALNVFVPLHGTTFLY